MLDGIKTPYTKYVYIPVTKQQGKEMSDYAEQLRNENATAIYNLYGRNCSMVTQDIMSMGGIDFATGSEDRDALDEQIVLGRALIADGVLGSFIPLIAFEFVKDY